jgi:hypothetical protein
VERWAQRQPSRASVWMKPGADRRLARRAAGCGNTATLPPQRRCGQSCCRRVPASNAPRTSVTVVVHFGDQTRDEMMIGWFDVIIPASSDPPATSD